MACYILGEQKLSFPEKLNLIKPLADDPNSGVREWAWMVLRADFTQELTKSIKLLSRWTEESTDNIKRFASELSRPRGVWCSHIKELRKEPWLGLDIIEHYGQIRQNMFSFQSVTGLTMLAKITPIG